MTGKRNTPSVQYLWRPLSRNLFEGTRYKVANWRHLGQTKGPGKLGSSGKQRVQIKDLRVYTLDASFRDRLTD
jgi:hypothetical protein